MKTVDRASRWIYRGIWGVLVRWFRVPDEPPTLPGAVDVQAFRPSEGFLRYLKFYFWFGLVLIDGLIFLGWLAITIAFPWLGLILALPAFLLATLPDIVAYIAIHLRYDATWYLVGRRTLRIRRGIWVLHETTITFENVQNIHVSQGPMQRYFGIADVLVETAGGGSGAGHHSSQSLHTGRIEGIDNAEAVRDLILGYLRQTRTAGLGDEPVAPRHETQAPRWSAAHLSVLREIRDAVRARP